MTTRSGGLLTTAVVVGVALLVALLASFVWPASSRLTDQAAAGRAPADVTGPVGRIGRLTTGGAHNSGGATDATRPFEPGGAGDNLAYVGSTGTGSISGPIGGLDAVGGAVSGARDTASSARGTVAAVRATPTTARR